MRVVAKIEAGTVSVECPFGWNWPRGERESLIASGLLTALIFGQEGRVVRYVEVRSDQVAFVGVDGHLAPESAIFDMGANPAGGDGVTLTLAPPGAGKQKSATSN